MRTTISKSLLVLAVAVLAGCQALTPAVQETTAELPPAPESFLLGKSGDRARVARDLVSAMQQIDGLKPDATSLLMQTPRDGFGHSFLKALEEARYSVEVQEEVSGDNIVDYEIITQDEKDLSRVTVVVGVDRLKLKRDYERENNRTRPASSLFVLGADPDNIILDSSIFDETSPLAAIQTASQGEADPVTEGTAAAQNSALSAGSAYSSLQLPPIIEVPDSTGSNGVGTRDTAPSTSLALRSNTSSLKRKRNMFDLGESNFREVLQSYQDVDRRVLVFGNDSMRLGSGNKWYIKTMSRKFDLISDAFSVIGCSFGHSKIENGNALLALGRAHRVKEELLRNGIPEENILDEGCWSGGERDESLPSRGVLLVLKRRA